LAEGGGIIKKVAEAVFKLLGKDAAKAGEKKAAQEAEEAALKKAEQEAGQAVARKANAPLAKFRDYLFKDGATHGKDAVFRSYGYAKEDSEALMQEYERQAAERFAAGEYKMGKLDQYGQRVTIPILLEGKGAAAGRSATIATGWMIKEDGTIALNTPFTGFYE
jgi:hypothetical protein